MFERPGSPPRGLIHLGETVFHPAGAEHVRVVFDFETGSVRRVRVLDPDVIFVAERIAAG